MFQRFVNPTVIYMRRIQRGLDEARMAALEHESAAEHHQALANMYRDRVRRLQAELAAVSSESAPAAKTESEQDEQSATQVRLISPRGGSISKRDEAAASGNGFMPQGATG